MTNAETGLKPDEKQPVKAKTTKGAVSFLRKAHSFDLGDVIGQKEYEDKFVIAFSNGHKYEVPK